MHHKTVTEYFAVAPQISPEDVETIKSLGYTAIINNRPDGEVPGQPTNAAIESAAKSAGLAYYHLPITSGQIPHDAIDQTKQLIKEIDGPTFAFCRSGTRSITLWALSQQGQIPSENILNAVSTAGYDLPFLAHYL